MNPSEMEYLNKSKCRITKPLEHIFYSQRLQKSKNRVLIEFVSEFQFHVLRILFMNVLLISKISLQINPNINLIVYYNKNN